MTDATDLERDWERLRETAERLNMWGKWGPDDEAGTVNYITKDMVRDAASLIQDGRVLSLSIDYGDSGPQSGHLRRFNPMSFMLRDGDDVYARALAGTPQGIGAADDVLILAAQGATHWDALGHMFYDSKMWNGYDARLVSSMGAEKNDIAGYRDRIVGRGVLLDLPKWAGEKWIEPGRGITGADLQACADSQGVTVGTGDILLIRFGQMAMCQEQGSWGSYAGGDAPGLAWDTLDWLHAKEVGGIAVDTWGAEVRPNDNTAVNQPWHRVALPMMGLLVGEIFALDGLAEDCAADGRYDFFFSACPLPFKGSVGGPINPIAVK
ncbi:cyclase family protein [soil metagenome]